MAKVLLLTTHNRPQFFRRVLDALARCHHIGEYTVLVSADTYAQDPALTEQCVQMAREFQATKDVRIRVHDPKLGIDESKLFAFPQAFKDYDYVCHLEDDMIPAWDFLLFQEWCAERYRRDPEILSISGYQNTGPEYLADPQYHFGVIKNPMSNVWGWGTWKDRWDKVIGDGSDYRAWAGEKANGLFDFYWKRYVDAHGLLVVSPRTSRVQNLVGAPGTPDAGTNSNDPQAMTGYNAHGSWELPEQEPRYHE